MNIQDAQKDMRQAYIGGGTGVLISGLVWLSAGITALFSTAQISLLVFFFGGMLIHPLGLQLSIVFGRSGKHQKENPLAQLAMESTFFLFIGLFLSYVVFQIRPEWFFPIMLLIIGGRYLIFASIYGNRIYWVLGGILAVAGMLTLSRNIAGYYVAISGGLLELLFAGLILFKEKKADTSG